MTSKCSRPALVLLLLVAACTRQSFGAAAGTPSFVISAGATQSESSPAVASQAFSKQWTISSDADGQIDAIKALALDLPGQVFVTYEATATATTSSTKQIGSIKVFGESEAAVDAVSVTSKRAMRGAKLMVSSTKSPVIKPAASNTSGISSSSSVPGTLLTEVVLLRKAALKKVVANGWADVVISDDVLFSKRKEDYSFAFNRALRATANTAGNASSLTLTESQREVVPHDSGAPVVSPFWTIATPTSGELGNVSLDLQIAGSGFTALTRIDSDFLPEGAIGTVATANGRATVASTRSADGRETLVVTPSTVNASVSINLAANVKLGSVTPQFQAGSGVMARNLNETFPDDAVSLFLNGSGNVFVLANNSAVYAQSASFEVAGSGFMQLEIGAMRAPSGVTVRKDFLSGMKAFDVVTGFTILDGMTCMWSSSTYTSAMPKATSDAAEAQGKAPRCPVAVVPKKVGGSSKPSSTSAPSSAPSSKGNSSAPSATGAASSSTGVSSYGVALIVAVVTFATLS